jgi:hypothetical protein
MWKWMKALWQILTEKPMTPSEIDAMVRKKILTHGIPPTYDKR